MTGIIIAACAVGVTGLLLGLFLGFMGKKFAVDHISTRTPLANRIISGILYSTSVRAVSLTVKAGGS